MEAISFQDATMNLPGDIEMQKGPYSVPLLPDLPIKYSKAPTIGRNEESAIFVGL